MIWTLDWPAFAPGELVELSDGSVVRYQTALPQADDLAIAFFPEITDPRKGATWPDWERRESIRSMLDLREGRYYLNDPGAWRGGFVAPGGTPFVVVKITAMPAHNLVGEGAPPVKWLSEAREERTGQLVRWSTRKTRDMALAAVRAAIEGSRWVER